MDNYNKQIIENTTNISITIPKQIEIFKRKIDSIFPNGYLKIIEQTARAWNLLIFEFSEFQKFKEQD